MLKRQLIDNRVIRVFISSTFQDMQGERDYLMKRTFPKLQKYAEQRDVMLTELDLRWGITEEEAKSGKVVDICLREIENSIPFFIGIIGDRYGWVPEAEDLNSDVIERFPSVSNYLDRRLSVTEMEMQFGVLERPEDMHAFFFIKENEGESDNLIMLKKLKEAVRSSRYPSSSYSSLEDLSNQVEHSFLTLLNQLYPETEVTEHQKEKRIQDSFIRKLSANYVKDSIAFSHLTAFAQSPTSSYLVVTGDSGMGKSSLLANWSKEYSCSQDFHIIPYFSSNGGNQTYSNILKYISDEMAERYGFDYVPGTEEDRLNKYFELFALKKDILVIVFDAINQIADVGQAKMLNWLPIPPGNIKYLFSTLVDDTTMQVFQNRNYPIYHLQKLNIEQKTSLIRYYLDSYGKRLTDSQTKRIADAPQSENTLVLRTLLDEIICNGRHETLDGQIDYYFNSGSVSEFYEKVLMRYEEDFGDAFVKTVLGLIAVSRNGVSEEALIHISGAKRFEWSAFYCSFSTHLNNQSGRLVFTHNYITRTVWNRYLDNDPQFERTCRLKLTNEICKNSDDYTKLEVPYQLDKLQLWDRLHSYISEPAYLNYCISYDEVEIGTYWRHILEGTPGNYSVEDYLNRLNGNEDLVLLYSNLLRLCQVLYLTRPQKHLVSLLLSYLQIHPEMATPQVYRTLSSNTPRPDSLTYANKSLELCKKNNDTLGIIDSLRLIGTCYYDAAVKENDDKYGKLAYKAWEEAKDLSVKLYGEMHPLVMHGYKDMCLVCDDDLDKALELSLKALDLSIAIYGADHPLTGRPYHYVGVIYRELKRWPEALHYFQEACRVWLPAYGRNHEIMNSSYGNQGKALMNLGRLEDALNCYNICLEIQSIIMEKQGYDYAVCQMNRATILSKMGRQDDAKSACNEVLKTLEKDEVKIEGRCKPLMDKCKEFLKTLS